MCVLAFLINESIYSPTLHGLTPKNENRGKLCHVFFHPNWKTKQATSENTRRVQSQCEAQMAVCIQEHTAGSQDLLLPSLAPKQLQFAR